jgi:hypothetical protein
MTVEQEDELLGWLDAYEKDQAEAAEKMKRGR